jgi:hypothetical protein
VKKLFSTLALLAFLIAVCGNATEVKDEITFSQVAKATKIYFRDSAEFPMRMNVELTLTDTSGRVRKHKTGKFDYDFHGYNPRSANASLNVHGPKPLIKVAAGIALSSLAAIEVLTPDAEKIFVVTLAVPAESGMISVQMVSVSPCGVTRWLDQLSSPEQPCGPLNLQLKKDDVSLQSFTFDQTRVPLPANIDSVGAVTISAYHVEDEFQKVTIAGDPNPFLVPKTFTVTMETDKGRIVLRAEYSVKK